MLVVALNQRREKWNFFHHLGTAERGQVTYKNWITHVMREKLLADLKVSGDD